MRPLSFVTLALTALFAIAMAFPALAQTVTPCPVCPELTWPQRIGGYVFSPFNIAVALGVIAVVGSGIYLFGKAVIPYLTAVFFLLSKQVWEFLGYGIAALLIASKFTLPVAAASWGTFAGCLWLAGMIAYSTNERKWDGTPAGFCGTLFVLWTPVALLTQYHQVGFLSVGALMGMMGFTAGTMPFGYYAGYKDDDAVVRGTWSAFVVLGAYSIIQAIGGHYPTLISFTSVFDEGALWWGGIAGYIGLIILSSAFYREANYWVMQIVTFVLCWAAILIGYNIGVEYLLKTGMTALVAWAALKPGDFLPRHHVALATFVFFWGVGLLFALWQIYVHSASWGQYLLFM